MFLDDLQILAPKPESKLMKAVLRHECKVDSLRCQYLRPAPGVDNSAFRISAEQRELLHETYKGAPLSDLSELFLNTVQQSPFFRQQHHYAKLFVRSSVILAFQKFSSVLISTVFYRCQIILFPRDFIHAPFCFSSFNMFRFI